MFAILARLAWRNLWRNHRRTFIMLAAIVLGSWAMIFMTALMRGMVTEVIKDGISALPGHVQVHHPKYRDDPSVAAGSAFPP
jgi:ABC-type lipoprotein release transport system permease subunit